MQNNIRIFLKSNQFESNDNKGPHKSSYFGAGQYWKQSSVKLTQNNKEGSSCCLRYGADQMTKGSDPRASFLLKQQQEVVSSVNPSACVNPAIRVP